MSFVVSRRINRQLIRNINSSVPAKKDLLQTETIDVSETSTHLPPPSLIGVSITTKGYQVCRPRKTSFAPPFKRDVQNEADLAMRTIALQHLQPSMMPAFYSKSFDLNTTYVDPEPITEIEIKNKVMGRYFNRNKIKQTFIRTPPINFRNYSTMNKRQTNDSAGKRTKIKHSAGQRHPVMTVSSENSQSDTTAPIPHPPSNKGRPNGRFKPPIHRLHFSAKLLITGKDDCKKPPPKRKEPCGWIKLEKEQEAKKKSNNTKNKKGGPKSPKKAAPERTLEPESFLSRASRQAEKSAKTRAQRKTSPPPGVGSHFV